MRHKPKRNFIKNIRPDTFKRPSSFNLKDAEEAASSSRTPKDVVLVGYRKTVASPNVHSRVIENELELGTFSPMSSGISQVPSSISNSVSLPVLDRSEWSRNSDGTMPEYMQVARRSLRAKKRQRNKKSKLITVDFVGGSDPDVSIDENSEDIEVPQRLKRALTDPIRHSNSVRNRTLNPENEKSPDNDLVDKTCVNDLLDKTGVNGDKISHEPQIEEKEEVKQDGKGTAKKQLDFQDDMYKNLSYCLTQALGDDGLHDSDKSDDETCIQNGYDEFVEEKLRTKEDHHISVEDFAKAESEHEGQTLDSEKNNEYPAEEESSIIGQQSNLTVRDILKNNVLQLTSPGARSDKDQEEDSRVILNGDPNAHLDILSISEVNIDRSNKSTSHGGSRQSVATAELAGTTDSGLALTGSHSTLASKDSSTVEIISEHDQISDNDAEITVIELLREEYKRTPAVTGHDLNKSISDFSDSGVSVMSHRNHKASSDSNLLQSVETLQTVDTLDVGKSPDVMVTSASFPDITKLAETPKELPKLVDKVGHSTVK